ncbi:MAG: UDP-2,4-diacetamido-2,4,6-trideoxy-beta-L-altropyranose hydrolase [Alteromonadaceae bacterium TMED7]|nr:UDP-2,4-diacetamido-2,4,6-trideoxy-beta-L-altropyranose hydrolase [Alteromonadaceae bacterium]RPH16987.1 MAG: UDP-2,4-diacetamido-2,4,6-trideoxy-beta-L-altropyranose hydrolase [Alteromonadaceae bacterium TMED7]|tara:strand:+ start:51842 stop:52888 length:1047 start_codon:yes stop_codon:yes gene_type:complete
MSCLVFCTGGGQNSGIGHVMRCQALAQAAEEQVLESLFIVNEAARKFILQRHEWCGAVLLAADTEQAVTSQVIAASETRRAVAIVVDGYDFSEAVLKTLSQVNVPLVLLDDIRQPGHQYADIISNPAGEVWQHEYQQANAKAMLCLGPQYRLLRREFSVTAALPVKHRFSLTINMGGSDPAGLTLPVLSALSEVLPEAPFRVVTGPGFNPSALAELKTFITGSERAIQHVHNCQDMADIWVNARLAVAAAGGSQFELVACQTPSVLITVAANQRQASQQATREGWCQVVSGGPGIDISALATTVKKLWQDEAQLTEMSKAAEVFAITDGAWQLLDAIGQWHDKFAEPS